MTTQTKSTYIAAHTIDYALLHGVVVVALPIDLPIDLSIDLLTGDHHHLDSGSVTLAKGLCGVNANANVHAHGNTCVDGRTRTHTHTGLRYSRTNCTQEYN